jgi:hypothetical protein
MKFKKQGTDLERGKKNRKSFDEKKKIFPNKINGNVLKLIYFDD